MLSSNAINEIQKRSQELNEIISLDDNSKKQAILELLKNLPEDDDAYYLGHLYAILIEIFLRENDSANVVYYTNKILLISGMALYEYCGNYCPFSEEKIYKILDCYAQEEKNKNFTEIWGKGRLLQFQNKFDDAINFYKNLIAKQSNNYNAYRMLARVYEECNDFLNAEKYLGKSEQIFKDPLTICFKANLAMKQYNFTKAEKCLKDTIKEFPNSSIPKYRIIQVLWLLEKKKEYFNKRSELLEKYPANTKYIFSTIEEYNEEEKKEIEQIITATKDGYNYTPAFRYLGDWYIKNEKKGLAYWKYNKAIKINKYSYFAWYNKIILLMNNNNSLLKESPRQLKLLQNSINIFTHIFVNCIQSNLFFENADKTNKNIIEEYEKSINKFPHTIYFYFELLDLYLKRDEENNKKEILELCNKISLLFSQSFIVFYKCYQICFNIEEYKIAKKYLLKCSKLSNNSKVSDILEQLDFFITPDKYYTLIKKINENTYLQTKKDFFYLACFYFDKCYDIQKTDYSKISLELIEKTIINFPNTLDDDSNRLVYALLLYYNNKKEKAKNQYSRIKNKDDIITQIEICADIFDINILFDLYKFTSNNDLIKSINFWARVLLYLLQYNLFDDNNSTISHYTKLSALAAMLSDEEMSPFRLCSLGSANDPKEGKTIYDFLINDIVNKASYLHYLNTLPTRYIAVQASFTQLEDALTMFRLYGKQEKNEGTGVNLVFNHNFFTDELKTPLSSCQKETFKENLITLNKKFNDNEEKREPLYWILYWDRKNKMYFNPQGIYKTLEINLTDYNNWYVLNKKQEEFKNNKDSFYKKYAKNISFVLHKLQTTVSQYCNNISSIENFEQLHEILLNISYLIKDVSFYDEKELRIINVLPISHNSILHDKTNYTLYKNYSKLSGFFRYPKTCILDKIIIGPKVDQKDTVREYLINHLNKAKMDSVKVIISEAPLA